MKKMQNWPIRVTSSNLKTRRQSIVWRPNITREPSETQSYIISGGGYIWSSSLIPSKSAERLLEGIPDSVGAFVISDDGSLIAACLNGSRPDVCVKSADALSPLLYRFEDYDSEVETLCFTHDSRYLLSFGGGSDRKALMFTMSDGSVVGSVSCIHGPTVSVVRHGRFVKNVKGRDTSVYLFGSCGSNSVSLWTFDPTTLVVSLDPIPMKVQREYTDCIFSPDYDYLVVSTSAGDIFRISVKSNSIIGTPILVNGSGGVSALAISSSHLFAGTKEGSISVYNFCDSELNFVQKISFPISATVTSLSYSAVGGLLVGFSSGDVYALMDPTKNPGQLELVKHCPTDSLRQISPFISNQKCDSFLSSSNELCKWTITPSSPVLASSVLYRARKNESILTFSTSPLLSLIGTSDSRVIGVDNEKKSPVWEFQVPALSSLAMTRAMRFAAIGTGDGELRMHDLRTREMKSRIKHHSGNISCLSFFKDESFAITAGRDSCVITYDLVAGKQLTCHRSVDLSRTGIGAMVLLNDQTTVLTSGTGNSKNLTLWDLRVMDPVASIPAEHVTSLASLEDGVGEAVLTSTGDGMGNVKIWDLKKMSVLKNNDFFTHAGQVNSLAFLPNTSLGRPLLVSGGVDHTVSVWDYDCPGDTVENERKNSCVIPKLNFSSSD